MAKFGFLFQSEKNISFLFDNFFEDTAKIDQHDHHLLEHFWKQNAASRVEICKLYIDPWSSL